MVYWDNDGRKDLLIGQSDGKLKLYQNIGTDEDPHFDAGTFVQVGESGSKVDIDVGYRATPTWADWNNNGREDLVVGALDGKLHLFLDEGSDALPDFRSERFVQENDSDLIVPTSRSSPHVVDWNGDGKKDLLSGNTAGQLLFYVNTGSDEDPSFSGYSYVVSEGDSIDLPGSPRSRPFVCNWKDDDLLDVLIGAGDGLVHLYQGAADTRVLAGADRSPFVKRADLLAARPNPFNPGTTIPFVLSEDQHVRLCVYDVSGRSVAVLADRLFGEGRNEIVWRGDDNNGRPVPSGVYFVRMDVRGGSESDRLVLLH